MKNSQIKSIKPLVLALALAGCNGGSDGSSSVGEAGQYLTPSEAEVELSENFAGVNLEGYVESSSGAELTELASLSPNQLCDAVSINDGTLTFDTSYELGSGCVLEYSVTNREGMTSAEIAHINASKSVSGIPSFVNTLHANATVSGLPVEINVESAPDFPPGFSLSEADIVLNGDGAVSLLPDGKTLQFTPGQESGVSIVYYTALSDTFGFEHVAVSGQVRVATSVDGDNQAPVVNGVKNLGEQDIYQTVTVDLSSVVSDTPGDTLDIIDVHSDRFTQVTSTGGLILDVKGELAGATQFSYTVTDHNGGYATGEVEVQFVNPMSHGSTSDGQVYFTSPVLVSEYINVTGKQPVATKTVAPYSFAVHTNNKNTDALADDIMISEYCEAINMRIADDEDVRVINDDLDNPAPTLSWPTTAGYQIAGGSDSYPGRWFDFVSNQYHSNTGGKEFFCVSGSAANTPPAVADVTPLTVEIYNKGVVTLNMSDPDSDGVSLVSVLHPKEVEVQYDQHGNIDVTALTEGSFKLTAIVEDDHGMQAHKEFEVNASRNDIPTILPNALIAPPVTRYEAEQAGLHIVSEYVNSLNNYPLVRSTALDAQEYCQKQGLSVLSTSLVEGWEAKSTQDIANVVGSFKVFAWDKNANLVRMNTSDNATSAHSDNQIVMCAGHPRGIRYTLDVPSLDLGLPATITVIAEDQQGGKWPMDLSSGKLECTPECDVTATTVTAMNQESKEVKWIGPSGITVVGLGTVAPFEMRVDLRSWMGHWPRDCCFSDKFYVEDKNMGDTYIKVSKKAYEQWLSMVQNGMDIRVKSQACVTGHTECSNVYYNFKAGTGAWTLSGDVYQLKTGTDYDHDWPSDHAGDKEAMDIDLRLWLEVNGDIVWDGREMFGFPADQYVYRVYGQDMVWDE